MKSLTYSATCFASKCRGRASCLRSTATWFCGLMQSSFAGVETRLIRDQGCDAWVLGSNGFPHRQIIPRIGERLPVEAANRYKHTHDRVHDRVGFCHGSDDIWSVRCCSSTCPRSLQVVADRCCTELGQAGRTWEPSWFDEAANVALAATWLSGSSDRIPCFVKDIDGATVFLCSHVCAILQVFF